VAWPRRARTAAVAADVTTRAWQCTIGLRSPSGRKPSTTSQYTSSALLCGSPAAGFGAPTGLPLTAS